MIFMYIYIFIYLQWDLYMGDIHLKGILTLYLSVRKNYILKSQHFTQKWKSAFETGYNTVFFCA